MNKPASELIALADDYLRNGAAESGAHELIRQLADCLRLAANQSGSERAGVDSGLNDQDEVLLAYGLLWSVSTTDKRVHSARRELLKCLNKELQAKAISAARTTMALVRDIRQIKGATFASDFDAPGPSSGEAHGDGYCGCTERCKDRDNCQYDVKPVDTALATPPAQPAPESGESSTSSDGTLPLYETAGGFPVAAAPYQAEETGVIQSTRQGAGVERGMDQCVTGGESAAPPSTHGKPDGAVRECADALLEICDGSNWPEEAQSGVGFKLYQELTEQLHDIALTLMSAALHSPKIAAAETSPGDVYREVIDEALIVRHLGVAKGNAKAELNQILDWDVAAALDPAVSGRKA